MEYLSFWLFVCSLLCLDILVNSTQELQYSILEDLLPGTFVANIFADSHIEDEGMSNLAGLRFRFLSHSDLDFAIEERTGIIRIGSRIDRDVICPQQLQCNTMLDVVAVTTSSKKFFRIFKVVIEIVDLNDNSPTFQEPEILHNILESTSPGSHFVIPTAVDPDSGVNGIRGYKLVPENKAFSLQVLENLDGSTDLRLVLNTWLDRESQANYQVKVTAYDGGQTQRSGTMDVFIAVQDTNDNSPTFENSSYAVNIPENIPIHSTIIRVRAVDGDAGLYGQVIYRFSSHTEHQYSALFGIGNTTGEIYVKDVVDYEKGNVYHLSVIAQDRGPDSLRAEVTVVVKVEDVNDHSPNITVNTLAAVDTDNTEIAEDSELGTFVAHLHVVDKDSGLNGNFSCLLNDNHNHFVLEGLYQGEYQIITKALLDREEWPQYTLSIMCQDRGAEPQVAIRHIKVTVLDANDNVPQFEEVEYTSRLVENNYLGVFLVEVKASDGDLGRNSQLSYKLADDAGDRFRVDSASGKITARAVFDHEQEPMVQFHVLAVDHGEPPRTGTAAVKVFVKDVNDARPVFSQRTYSFSVEENQPAGMEVGIAVASDPDSKMYNTFTYSLVPSYLVINTFTVDSQSGIITTKVPLDRESQSVYYLTVVVKDSGVPPLSSSCSVMVHVADQNDNDPVFDFPSRHNNSIYISNKVPPGQVVTRVTAHDLDIGNNGNLSFSLLNDVDVFHLDSVSGSISVAQVLNDVDFEVFEILVSAQDHGSPARVIKSAFNIVVNKSIHYPYDKESVVVGRSVAIIASIAIISGILMVILILAIVALRCKDRRRRNKEKKYHCHMAPMKIVHAHDGEGSLPSSPHKVTILPLAPEPHRYDSSMDKTDTQLYMNHSHEQDRYGYSSSTTANHPSLESMPSEGHMTSVPPMQAPRPWTLPHKELEVHQLLDMIKQDQDADSAYSGESSNTDSGRGISEEGEAMHRISNNSGAGRGHQVHPTSSFTGGIANGNASMPQPGKQTFSPKSSTSLGNSHYNHQVELCKPALKKAGLQKRAVQLHHTDSPCRSKSPGNHNHYGNHNSHPAYPTIRPHHGSFRTPRGVPNISETIPEESPYGYYHGNTFYMQGAAKKDTVV